MSWPGQIQNICFTNRIRCLHTWSSQGNSLAINVIGAIHAVIRAAAEYFGFTRSFHGDSQLVPAGAARLINGITQEPAVLRIRFTKTAKA